MAKAFISYAWEDDTHKTWVRKFAEKLRTDGVEVILDHWHLAPGDQLTEFMEKSIRDNDFVLIICTAKYKSKSDQRDGGVGYEGDIITSEVFTQRNQRKFIPILRSGEWDNSAPSWLLGKMYIDLRGTAYSEENYNDLLATIHNRRLQAPPVGRVPAEKIQQPMSSKIFETSSTELIKVEGIIVDEVTVPKLDGTPGSALYAIPFKLSRRPSSIWEDVFIETWNRPPSWTSMHRPGIARVVNDKIILDGTTVEEVEKYHRQTIKLAIERANQFVVEYEQKKKEQEAREKLKIQKHEEEIQNAVNRISFD